MALSERRSAFSDLSATNGPSTSRETPKYTAGCDHQEDLAASEVNSVPERQSTTRVSSLTGRIFSGM